MSSEETTINNGTFIEPSENNLPLPGYEATDDGLTATAP